MKRDFTVFGGKLVVLCLVFGIPAVPVAHAGESQLLLSQSSAYDSSSGRITYNLNWQTATGTSISNLNLEDVLPPGTTFVSASDGGILDNGRIKWNMGNVNSGQASFVARVDAAQALNLWATNVVSFSQGLGSGGQTVTQILSDSGKALGASDAQFVALGFGQNGKRKIVLAFGWPVFNGPGADIKIFGSSGVGEKVKLEVGNNLADWTEVSLDSNNQADIGSFNSINYARLTDITDPNSVPADSKGFQVDAVKGLQMVPLSCGIMNDFSASGSVNGNFVTAQNTGRTDLTAGCWSTSGGSGVSGVSGLSGISGISGISNPPPPAASPSPSPSPVTPPSGGGGGTVLPAPADMGGGESEPPAQSGGGSAPSGGVVAPTPLVLGAINLPRTGIPNEFWLLYLPMLLMVMYGISLAKMRRKIE